MRDNLTKIFIKLNGLNLGWNTSNLKRAIMAIKPTSHNQLSDGILRATHVNHNKKLKILIVNLKWYGTFVIKSNKVKEQKYDNSVLGDSARKWNLVLNGDKLVFFVATF